MTETGLFFVFIFYLFILRLGLKTQQDYLEAESTHSSWKEDLVEGPRPGLRKNIHLGHKM